MELTRQTWRRWEHPGTGRVLAVPDALARTTGGSETGFQIGIEQNPMTREQLAGMRRLLDTVLEEWPEDPPAKLSVTLDPLAGIGGPLAPGDIQRVTAPGSDAA